MLVAARPATSCARSRTSACSCSSSAPRSSRASSTARPRRSARRSPRATCVEAGVQERARDRALRFRRRHAVRRGARSRTRCGAVSGEGCDALVGARFSHNASLCRDGGAEPASAPVQGRVRPRPPGAVHQALAPRRPCRRSWCCRSSCTSAPLGTLVLGAKRRAAFGDAVRPTLEVLAQPHGGLARQRAHGARSSKSWPPPTASPAS